MTKETRKLRIERVLREAYQPSHLVLNDETSLHLNHSEQTGVVKQETHFSIFIKAEKLSSMNRVMAHRQINQLLKKEFMDGLHALSIHIVR